MKTLFNEYLALNEEGGEISKETLEFLNELSQKHPGINPRDLGVVILNAVSGFTSAQILRYAMGKRKLEKIHEGKTDAKLP